MNLRANLRYLRIVLRHKWYVLRFGFRTVPLWRLIIHDISKFSRAEWSAYRDRFASGRAGKEDKALDPQAFKDAWRHHYLSNPHHWEFWLAENNDGIANELWNAALRNNRELLVHYDTALNVFEMPETYVHEMVADWKAASKAYSGKDNCWGWYEATRDRQVMHPDTRKLVERLLRRR